MPARTASPPLTLRLTPPLAMILSLAPGHLRAHPPQVVTEPAEAASRGEHPHPAHARPAERPQRLWGGITLGLAFAAERPRDQLSTTASRIEVNHMQPLSGPLRGVDLRWQDFTAARGRSPRHIGYFRSGFYGASAAFTPDGPTFLPGQATAVEVLTVPLFFGGNHYLFRDFPLRPYAGLGFGFDVMRLRYTTQGGGVYSDVSARIGFELHAGLEARFTNHLAISVEVMQLWSARRRLPGLPHVSNETFAAVLAVTGAFELPR